LGDMGRADFSKKKITPPGPHVGACGTFHMIIRKASQRSCLTRFFASGACIRYQRPGGGRLCPAQCRQRPRASARASTVGPQGQYCLGMMSSLIPEPKSGCNISEGFNGMRGHVGNRSPVLRAPETLPSGRAAVSLFWPNSTVSANRKHSLQNSQALRGSASSGITLLILPKQYCSDPGLHPCKNRVPRTATTPSPPPVLSVIPLHS